MDLRWTDAVEGAIYIYMILHLKRHLVFNYLG